MIGHAGSRGTWQGGSCQHQSPFAVGRRRFMGGGGGRWEVRVVLRSGRGHMAVTKRGGRHACRCHRPCTSGWLLLSRASRSPWAASSRLHLLPGFARRPALIVAGAGSHASRHTPPSTSFITTDPHLPPPGGLHTLMLY